MPSQSGFHPQPFSWLPEFLALSYIYMVIRHGSSDCDSRAPSARSDLERSSCYYSCPLFAAQVIPLLSWLRRTEDLRSAVQL